MIIDIVQTIINFGKLVDQISAVEVNKYVYCNSYIYSLDASFDCNIDQKIIEQEKFRRLWKLNCSCNENIFSVNHLADSLLELYCSSEENEFWMYRQYYESEILKNSGICQEGISELKKLKKLRCSGNRYIYNVNHLADTLEDLDCGGDECNISDSGICELKNLKILRCDYNFNIKNLDIFGHTLEILECRGGCCGIYQDGIANLKKVKKLYCCFNPNIVNVNHLSETLEELDCSSTDCEDWEDYRDGTVCGVDQEGISKLKNIKVIKYYNNNKIYSVDHL